MWQSFLGGTLSTGEREIAASHLTECRACRRRVVALHESAVDERDIHRAPDGLKRRVRDLPITRPGMFARALASLRRPAPLAFAATVLIVAGLSILVYRNRQLTSETPRVSDLRRSSGPTSELALASPPNGAQLNRGPVEFRWTDAGNSATYQFTLTDDKGDIVVQEKPTATSLVIDTAKLRLSPKRNYYWSVSAILPNGARRESGIAGFTLK